MQPSASTDGAESTAQQYCVSPFAHSHAWLLNVEEVVLLDRERASKHRDLNSPKSRDAATASASSVSLTVVGGRRCMVA